MEPSGTTLGNPDVKRSAEHRSARIAGPFAPLSQLPADPSLRSDAPRSGETQKPRSARGFCDAGENYSVFGGGVLSPAFMYCQKALICLSALPSSTSPSMLLLSSSK